MSAYDTHRDGIALVVAIEDHETRPDGDDADEENRQDVPVERASGMSERLGGTEALHLRLADAVGATPRGQRSKEHSGKDITAIRVQVHVKQLESAVFCCHSEGFEDSALVKERVSCNHEDSHHH